MWTILSAIPKSDIMKRITMYEKMKQQKKLSESLEEADSKYHVKKLEDEKCIAENAGN